jgi:hypothetical protein
LQLVVDTLGIDSPEGKAVEAFKAQASFTAETVNNVADGTFRLSYKDGEGSLVSVNLDPNLIKFPEDVTIPRKRNGKVDLTTEFLRGPVHSALEDAGMVKVTQGHGVLFPRLATERVLGMVEEAKKQKDRSENPPVGL